MARFVAIALVAASFLSAGEFAAAQPVEGEYYRIRSVNSKKVLSLDDGASKVDGALIVQRAQGPFQNQQWKFVKMGDYYKIINHKSGQALNVQNASYAEGAPIIQWDASNNDENQQWSLEKHGKNFVLKARHSGMVIDMPSDSQEPKGPVVQAPYQEGRNQLVELVPLGAAARKSSVKDGKRLRDAQLTALEQEFVKKINAARRKQDLSPLLINAPLVAACREHASVMAKLGKLQEEFDGKGNRDRIHGAGVIPLHWGVTCGKGKSTEEMIKSWLEDSTAKDNILQADVNELGLGVATLPSGENYVSISYVQIVAPVETPESSQPHPVLGKAAPDFELPLLGGGKFKLANHKDKQVVLLDFWASWCPACVALLPAITEVAEKYKSQGVVFYAVNIQEAPDTISSFLKEQGLKIAVPLDPQGEIANKYSVQYIPQTVIIGTDGLVKAVYIGLSPDDKEILSKDLEAALAGKKRASKKAK